MKPARRRLVAAVIGLGAGVLPALTTSATERTSALWAVSDDGRWLLLARAARLWMLDRGEGGGLRRRDDRPEAPVEIRSARGGPPAEAAELHFLARRRSFVVAFRGVGELWEISVDALVEPMHEGLVHDYRMGEAIATPGFLRPRRTRVERPLSRLAFDASQAFVLGTRPGADAGEGTEIELLNLDIRRSMRVLQAQAKVDTAAAWPTRCQGRELFVLPRTDGGPALALDLRAARWVAAPGCSGR